MKYCVFLIKKPHRSLRPVRFKRVWCQNRTDYIGVADQRPSIEPTRQKKESLAFKTSDSFKYCYL